MHIFRILSIYLFVYFFMYLSQLRPIIRVPNIQWVSFLVETKRVLCEVRSFSLNVLTYLLTYLLTPWSRALLEKLTGFAANQETPRILWNPKVHHRTHNN